MQKWKAKGERSTPKNIYDYTKDVNDYPLLKEFLNKVRPEFKSDDEPIKPLLNDISSFTEDAKQFDDMTLLLLDRHD